ncbi:MAG: pyridoxal-phosphate dependent enzyme [Thermogemmatispora sp.]|uniref:threonine synthase n=1 Tax=Thermogemmatispora sp. TaxID=1968838 RepID=UPI0019FA6567|nr:pyridoxal-phosphate dependent enzyme [Thermogemmatispora sp.]MBE3567254.1 pyridoxal-phosphate dependent enzyme [Thermogemmatispora sp.]
MLLASHILKLECVLCGSSYTPGSVTYTCPNCGPQGTLLVQYDYDQIRWNYHAESRDPSIRRYRPFLPIPYGNRLPPLIVGGTPLYPAERLRKHLNMRNLWLKDETRNPSGSHTDRGAFVATSLALPEERKLVSASTGDSALALSQQAAALGLSCQLFLPSRSARKLAGVLQLCGARIFAVDGSYDDAFDLSVEATAKFGWYNVNIGYNPYIVEGLKTVGLEIAEQLGHTVPDAILVPVADGGLISGIYRGFEDLRQLGIVRQIPRLIAVQTEGAPAFVRSLGNEALRQPEIVSPTTQVESLAVGHPHNGAMALRHVRQSGGFGITVSDEALLKARQELAALTGIFVAPAGAASYAALLQLLEEGKIKRHEMVVLLATASGQRSGETIEQREDELVTLARGSEGLQSLELQVSA